MDEEIKQQALDIQSMLFDPGDPCDLGCQGSVNQDLIDQATAISKAPCCFVDDWMIWDLDFQQDNLKQLEAWGKKPSIIYAHYVIEDQHGRFLPGDNVRSSVLKEFHAPGFFLTGNTMYVLMGRGTRKTVDPKLVSRIIF